MIKVFKPFRDFLRNRYAGNLQTRIIRCVGEQFVYGQRETLLRYTGLDKGHIFLAKLSHSGHTPAVDEGRVQLEFDWNGKPLLQALWNEENFNDASSRGISNLVTIGATYLYSLANSGIDIHAVKENIEKICTDWNWGAELDRQKACMQGRRVLILPTHSWEGDVTFNFGRRSKLLELQNHSTSISFCLGYLDYLDPQKRLFYGAEESIELECAGLAFASIQNTPAPARENFFQNLTEIFSKYDLILGEEFTTGLLYASSLGKQVGILSSELGDSRSEKSTWTEPNVAIRRRRIYREHYDWLNSGGYSKQLRLEKFYNELGISSFRSKSDLLKLLPTMEVEW